MAYILINALGQLLHLISLAILARVIMSWVYPRGQVFFWLVRLTEPILSPFRRLSRKIMELTSLPLDFTPWLAMVALSLVTRVLWSLYALIFRGWR